MVAFSLGIGMAIFMIFSMKAMKTENTVWAYPLTLLSLPLIYVVFAIVGHDFYALGLEMLIGLPFLVITIVCCKQHLKNSAYIMAAGWMLHGVYDAFHPALFHNAGIPEWWPVFCGAVDVIIGLYLLVLARRLPQSALVHAAA